MAVCLCVRVCVLGIWFCGARFTRGVCVVGRPAVSAWLPGQGACCLKGKPRGLPVVMRSVLGVLWSAVFVRDRSASRGACSGQYPEGSPEMMSDRR